MNSVRVFWQQQRFPRRWRRNRRKRWGGREGGGIWGESSSSVFSLPLFLSTKKNLEVVLEEHRERHVTTASHPYIWLLSFVPVLSLSFFFLLSSQTTKSVVWLLWTAVVSCYPCDAWCANCTAADTNCVATKSIIHTHPVDDSDSSTMVKYLTCQIIFLRNIT